MRRDLGGLRGSDNCALTQKNCRAGGRDRLLFSTVRRRRAPFQALAAIRQPVRRRNTPPIAPKPTIIIAQVEGSGTPICVAALTPQMSNAQFPFRLAPVLSQNGATTPDAQYG